MKDDEQWSAFVDQDRRKRDLLACLRAKINPDASDHEVFGKLPLQFVGVNTVETLMKVKLEKRRVPDTMEPRTRVVTSNAEAANSRRKWLSGVFNSASNKDCCHTTSPSKCRKPRTTS